MSNKTFIQLINDVGKNLRLSDGTTYTTLTDDADVVFIAQAVNLAKDMVEGEAQWENMHEEVLFNSQIGVKSYDTSDIGVVAGANVTLSRSQLVETFDGHMSMWDKTDPGGQFRMRRRSHNWIRDRQIRYAQVTVGQQYEVSVVPNGDGLTVTFPYSVTEVRNYDMHVYTPQDELDATSTVMEAPWRPVVLAATALAAEERGEELGMQASSWWERYNSALSQAMVVNMLSAKDATLIAT